MEPLFTNKKGGRRNIAANGDSIREKRKEQEGKNKP